MATEIKLVTTMGLSELVRLYVKKHWKKWVQRSSYNSDIS